VNTGADSRVADELPPDLPPGLSPRQAHRRRLVQAVSHRRLWAGLHRPWATWALLALLVLIHLALALRIYHNGRADLVSAIIGSRSDPLLIRAGAQYGRAIARGETWRLVSCIFLHGSGLHLFMNGLALVGLGRLCEALYGRTRFIALFLISGIAGSALSYAGGHQLSIGASGAIFGLLGAPIVFGWRHRAELPPEISRWLRRSLAPWVVLNLFIGLVVPFIDNLAHVGGLIAGVLMALVLGNRVVPGREGSPIVTVVLAVASSLTLVWAAVGVAGKWL